MYDGQSVVAEKDGSGTITASYTNGRDRVISRTKYGTTTTTEFFLYDGNMNLDAIVDEDGDLVQQFTYDVFGAIRTTAGSGQTDSSGRFSGGIGHVADAESGLTYMRARYYDPSLGRFISEDPGRNGTNWYVYCGNNPVNNVDPSGNSSIAGWAACVGIFLKLAYEFLKGEEVDLVRLPMIVPIAYLAYMLANPASPMNKATREFSKLAEAATGLPAADIAIAAAAGYMMFLDMAMDWLFGEGFCAGEKISPWGIYD